MVPYRQWITVTTLVLTNALSAVSHSSRPGEKAKSEQTQDVVTAKLLGARYDAKKKELLVRVEVWGRDQNTVDFGSPTILVDGKRASNFGSSVAYGTGKKEPG